MLKYVLKRIAMMIPVFLGVIVLIFLILQASPGDPAQMVLGEMATQDQINALREELGLNQPILIQLGNYLIGLVHGDFGSSYMSKAPVPHNAAARKPKCSDHGLFWDSHRNHIRSKAVFLDG